VVGGPETFTQNQVAAIEFKILDKKPKVTYIPDWIRIVILKVIKIFTGSKTYGPAEFFLTVMAMDMLAPEYGRQPLEAFFLKLKDMDS
jgi:hypothetical protein